MRAYVKMAVLALMLATVGMAWGQSASVFNGAQKTSVFSGSVNPQPIRNVPVDTSRTVAPIIPVLPPQPNPFFTFFANLFGSGSKTSPANPTPFNPNVYKPQAPFIYNPR